MSEGRFRPGGHTVEETPTLPIVEEAVAGPSNEPGDEPCGKQ
jgi:hypothetical protein